MKKCLNIFLSIGLFMLPMNLFAQQDATGTKKTDAEKSMPETIKQNDPEIFNNMYFFAEFGNTNGYKDFIVGGVYVQLQHHYFKIKYASGYDEPSKAQKQRYKEDKDCNCTESNSIADLSFMYGKSYQFFKFSQIQFGTGVSFFTKTYPHEVYNAGKSSDELNKYRHQYSIGIVTEVRYLLQLKRYLAANASINFSANPIKSYNGWAAGLAFGLL